MGKGKSQAEQLARELAREALFLPDRWRAWLLTAISEDLAAADLEQHRFEILNARMSEAVRVLEQVAKHLKLDQEQRLALTMREFDAAPEKIREGWRARKVADDIRGSWQLAKSIAFDNKRLPVAPERKWERGRGLRRKRREAAFALGGVAQWLETKPAKKTQAAYEQWSKQENQKRDKDLKPLLHGKGIWKIWLLPWPEIVKAVEDKRLPGEATRRAEKSETDAVSADAPSRNHAFVLDPKLRAQALRSAREARGWSIKEVAEAASLDPSTLASLERGQVQQPAFENIAKLAEVLDLQLNDFVRPA
jgi:DNA-binding Xre family transcriptional regulator